MIKINIKNHHKSKSIRLSIFRIFVLEIGLHELNGTHIQTGIGLGPMEMSFTLHQWNNW